jgi:Flp pilus assembly protein TadG
MGAGNRVGNPRRSLCREISGATAAEFALVFPLALLFLLGAVELGRMLWLQNSLQYAAEQAVRCAVVNTATCSSASAIEQYAANLVYGTQVSSTVFSVTYPSGGVQVSASLTFTPLIPVQLIMAPLSFELTAQSYRPS